jgi:hypothetical protein
VVQGIIDRGVATRHVELVQSSERGRESEGAFGIDIEVGPSGERLNRDNLSGGQIDDRLVCGAKISALEQLCELAGPSVAHEQLVTAGAAFHALG